MEFSFDTKSDDFFGALLPLIPRGVDIAHQLFESVLINYGKITKGEYDKEQGKTALFVNEFSIRDKSKSFEVTGYAFASTPSIEELTNSVLNIKNYTEQSGLYSNPPSPDESLSAHIEIQHMPFPPGQFTVSLSVRRYRDGGYGGYIYVKYDTFISNSNEAEKILKNSSLILSRKLSTQLDKVYKAKSNKEKKDSLEEFASIALSQVMDFKLGPRNKRTSDSEYDLVIYNETQDPFLMYLSNPILVECKNHSTKVKSRDVKVFAQNIRMKNLRTGFLFTMEGVSGDSNRDSIGFIRTLYSAKNTVVIVFDKSDYERMIRGVSVYEIVRKKYYEIVLS
ncbi:MAG: restriction endonuclease [Promethearchaeota archaeon]